MLKRRNFILIFFVICLGLLIWRGPAQLMTDLQAGLASIIPIERPLTLARLNAPPEIDPACLGRLGGMPKVQIRGSSDFVQQETCVVAGALYADRLADLPFSPQGPLMRCEVADPLQAWLEQAVKPAARQHLKTEIVTVGHLGTYNCRTITSGSAVLSQHSFANAIDIAWFELADGRQIKLADGWSHEDESIQKFWRQIHRLSCTYFDVSLSPNYDTAHHDHFHFDMGPYNICR